jgi:carbon monoxide dehydrogenase subunit G
MTQPTARTYQDSVVVAATPEAVYDLVSDVTRTGEWSPVCTSCWWDDESEAGRVGARFTGRNETPDRTWETRSQVVAAERGREFAWVVGQGFVRWGFLLEPKGEGTRLTRINSRRSSSWVRDSSRCTWGSRA